MSPLNRTDQTYPKAKDFELHNYHCHDMAQQNPEIFCCANDQKHWNGGSILLKIANFVSKSRKR